MVRLSGRHDRILDFLAQRGYVAIEEMVAAFGVTPQTLRRDLQVLAERGLLRRHHGGASANLSTANLDYGKRHVEMEREKAAIGRAAAELVKPGSSLFLSNGTTVDALARAIADRRPRGLSVVTNSTIVAAILDPCPEITIEVTGGTWMRDNRALGGPAAVFTVERYRCDLHMTGIGGIDREGNLLEYREPVAIVGRAMLANARHRVLLADHSKFARVATSRLASLHDVDTLVTDRPPEPRTAALIAEAGCRLIVPD